MKVMMAYDTKYVGIRKDLLSDMQTWDMVVLYKKNYIVKITVKSLVRNQAISLVEHLRKSIHALSLQDVPEEFREWSYNRESRQYVGYLVIPKKPAHCKNARQTKRNLLRLWINTAYALFAEMFTDELMAIA